MFKLKLNLPIITAKRHNKIVEELITDRDMTIVNIQDEKIKALGWLQKSNEQLDQVRREKTNYENQVRVTFWNLAQVDAIIKTEYCSGYNTYYRYMVYFKPVLTRPGFTDTWARVCRNYEARAEQEATIQHRLIEKVGVPEWEYITTDRMLKRTYSDLEGLLRAPADIKTAVEYLNKHLSNLLKEQTYRAVLDDPAQRVGTVKEEGK